MRISQNGFYLVLAAALFLTFQPKTAVAQCYVSCRCYDMHGNSGSERQGPFYSTGACNAAVNDMSRRCTSASPGLMVSCSSCSGCAPAQQAPKPQQTTPAAPPPPPPKTPKEQALELYENNRYMTPEQEREAVRNSLARQQAALNEIEQARTGKAVSQLVCQDFLSSRAVALVKEGKYDDASVLAGEAESSRTGGLLASSCGVDPWSRYLVPDPPPPTPVPLSPRQQLTVDLNLSLQQVKQAETEVVRKKEEKKQVEEARRYWTREVETIKAQPPESKNDDILAQAMAALEQSEAAYQNAEQALSEADRELREKQEKARQLAAEVKP